MITGKLHAVGADGDSLSFTGAQDSQSGGVLANPDRTTSCTPDPRLAGTGGTDLSAIKVTDKGFHLHGPLGYLKPTFGHSAEATITVSVRADRHRHRHHRRRPRAERRGSQPR